MSSEYRNNHYVPIWYQKRFLPHTAKDKELYYLNLDPELITDPHGVTHRKNALHKQGFKHCFVEKDLYTTTFQSIESTDIEKIFFGQIDSKGRSGVDYFTNFVHSNINYAAFENMMMYMSTQKLRTPKGLGWLGQQFHTADRHNVLRQMLRLRQLYCAIWTEAIWLIADASLSDTKFIISDHPVTVYNRACPPESPMCQEYNDPEIWQQATHTIFPLSLEKILILTNLSWVRNPYQSEIKLRPNPNPMRGAIFKYTDVQTLRHLSESEVLEINYIIKSRAFKYIAGAKEEWLYPENFLPSLDWHQFGDGYLLMPDPRAVNMGGEIVIGHKDGTASWFDAYGRRPWQSEYGQESGDNIEFDTLYHFKGEFARLYGPRRRGRTFNAMRLDNELDDEEFHQYHLGLEKQKSIRKLWQNGNIKIGRNDPCPCGSGLKWKKCGYLTTDRHKELNSKFIDVY